MARYDREERDNLDEDTKALYLREGILSPSPSDQDPSSTSESDEHSDHLDIDDEADVNALRQDLAAMDEEVDEAVASPTSVASSVGCGGRKYKICSNEACVFSLKEPGRRNYVQKTGLCMWCDGPRLLAEVDKPHGSRVSVTMVLKKAFPISFVCVGACVRS